MAKSKHPFKVTGCEYRNSNTYRMVVFDGFNADGSRRRFTRTVQSDSIDDLKTMYAEFMTQVKKGLIADPTKTTFEQFITKWLSTHAEKHLEPKTLYRYKEMLDSRIIPYLGDIKLEKIQPSHLLEFYDILSQDGIRKDGKEGGLSCQTILHHHRLISTILQDAVEWQLIISNPARRVKPPKVEKKEAAFYDYKQTSHLLELLEKEPLKYRVMIVLDIFTGVRCGELMGFTWSSIDFDKSTIQVKEASQYLPDRGTFKKKLKTKTSYRKLSLPQSVIELLKKYKAWYNEERLKAGDQWNETDRLFVTWDGKPMFTYTPSNWFGKFIERKMLPKITLHGLRHTNAALLLSTRNPSNLTSNAELSSLLAYHYVRSVPKVSPFCYYVNIKITPFKF